MSTATITTEISQTVPAERIKPGVGIQRVNVLDRDGQYSHQITHRGTEAQARAKAALEFTHDTDPRHAELVAILRGEETSTPDTDRILFASELKRGHRVTDDTARGDGVVIRTATYTGDPLPKILVWFSGNSYAASYWADDQVPVTRASSPEYDA